MQEATTDDTTAAHPGADCGCSQPPDCMRLGNMPLRQHSHNTQPDPTTRHSARGEETMVRSVRHRELAQPGDEHASEDNDQQHCGKSVCGMQVRLHNCGLHNVAVHLRAGQYKYGPWWPLPQRQRGKKSAGSVTGKLQSAAARGDSPGYYRHPLSKVHPASLRLQMLAAYNHHSTATCNTAQRPNTSRRTILETHRPAANQYDSTAAQEATKVSRPGPDSKEATLLHCS